MSKVEEVGIWLSTPSRPCVSSSSPRSSHSQHTPSLLLHPYLPLPLQPVGNPFTPFFLLSHPTPAPERSSAAVVGPELVETTEPYLKGPGDLALLVYNVVLFSFLRLVLIHALFPALARKPSILHAHCFKPSPPPLLLPRSLPPPSLHPASLFLPPSFHNHLPDPMKRYYLSQIVYWLQQALSTRACAFSAVSARLARIDGAIRLRLAHRSFFIQSWRLERACVDLRSWPLKYEWNAGRQSLTCRLALVPMAWRVTDSRRTLSVAMRVFLTFIGALCSWGVPRPEPNAGACKANASLPVGAVLGHAESGVPMWCGASKCVRFTGSGHVYAQRPVDRYSFLRLRR
ncbi:hypothetical protein B0H13DRAFT_2394724 [Mycena leptocephala]|nr:hypothetical protein B0H13DRAFT_2394724 [Mycena leptocephala]